MGLEKQARCLSSKLVFNFVRGSFQKFYPINKNPVLVRKLTGRSADVEKSLRFNSIIKLLH